jgi:hypothetical protein
MVQTIMRLLVVAILSIFSSFYCVVQPALAMDKSLIGSWHGKVKNSDIRWEIRFGGACSWTTETGQGSLTDTGVLSADNGQWMKSSKAGSDSGSYTFSGADKFTTDGKLGRVEWIRINPEAASSPQSSLSSPVVSSSYHSASAQINHGQSASESYMAASSPNASFRPSGTSSPSSSSNASFRPSGAPSPSSSSSSASSPPSVASSSNPSSPPTPGVSQGNRPGHSKLKQFFKNVAPMVGAAASIAVPPSNPHGSNFTGTNQPDSNGSNTSGWNQTNPNTSTPTWNGSNQTSYYPEAWSGRDPRMQVNTDPPKISASFAGADVKALLLDNFPLPKGGDEAEQLALPGLAKMAGGGMRKREFRAVF